MAHIPYGRQDITEQDIQQVLAVLNSDYLTQGPQVPRFEAKLTELCHASHAVAVCNATAALHIACLALDLGPGDWLWTTPVTFVASANCGLYCGAKVDFVDIDPKTYNMCPQALAEKLAVAAKANRLPKIVVPVHLSGQSCDMKSIRQLADQYGFKVIEDASHAIGGRYLDQPIGNCQYSDITVFSFHPVKIVTTAEGGAALTNQKALAEKMALLRSHGITRDPAHMTRQPEGAWYYQQIALGFNYRMTELQAALGVSQLDRLSTYVNARHEIAARYARALANSPLILPWQHPDTYSGLHLYIVRVDAEKCHCTRDQLFQAMRDADIGVNVHYIPVHLQPYFQSMGFKSGDFPQSEHYYQQAMSLPMYPGLSAASQQKVLDVIGNYLGQSKGKDKEGYAE